MGTNFARPSPSYILYSEVKRFRFIKPSNVLTWTLQIGKGLFAGEHKTIKMIQNQGITTKTLFLFEKYIALITSLSIKCRMF